VHYVLIYEVVPDYLERRRAFREEHLKKAREAHSRNEIVLAGALAEPADSAMIVFRIPGQAEAFAESDPYVLNGLVKSWRVRKWNVVVGDGGAA
jgi:uncharacterized protein